MAIKKGFSLSSLFSMDASEKEETTTVDEKPVWSSDVIDKPDSGAFDRLPKGDKQEDF